MVQGLIQKNVEIWCAYNEYVSAKRAMPIHCLVIIYESNTAAGACRVRLYVDILQLYKIGKWNFKF